MIPNTLPQSLVDNPRLDQWIGFEAPGTVRLCTGKVEIGQGVLTALAQIAAEELDIVPARLRIVSGNTGQSPAEGYTAGSFSIEIGGGSVRLAAAEARLTALERAAQRLGADIAELSVADGKILRKGQVTGLDYWAIAPDLDFSVKVTGRAPVKRRADYKIVGQSLPRIDLAEKIYGQGFIHDMAPAGVVHARVLHQPWPGAIPSKLDATDVAKAANGAIEIVQRHHFVAVTGRDEAAVLRAHAAAERRIAWSGARQEPNNAPQLLRSLPAVDRTIDHPGKPAASKAVRRHEAIYTKPYIAHASIAPSCGLARLDGGKLTVWTHSQGVMPLRGAMARGLKMDPANITLIHTHGAGCYGHNGADDAAFDAAVIACERPGETIRVVWTRHDELATSPLGSAMVVQISAGLDASGRPADWTHELWSGPHGQRPGASGNINILSAAALPDQPELKPVQDVPDASGGGGVRNAILLYDLPPQKIIHHMIPEMPLRVSSMRGLGAFANITALESFVDELAEMAGVDPVAYRLNMTSDPRMRRVIERAASMAHWRERGPAGTGKGRGFAFSRYKNRAGYLAIAVDVEVAEEVRFVKAWCAVDAGLVINPDGMRNQIEGGILQAASWALKEAFQPPEPGTAMTWDNYPILTFSELPELDIELMDSGDNPALGVGEVAHGPTGAALANAVAHALGLRIRDVPLTRERIAAAALAAP
jgi:nicotinate dehydrogenase subunit B